MIKEIIFEAQDYLTTVKDDQHKRIIDLDPLVTKHKIDEVIRFLADYERDKQRALKNMLSIDKTNGRVDEMVATLFRLHMAIDTLKRGREVKDIGAIKQGAGKSGKHQRRYRRGNNRSRRWQNRSHDEKNRTARYPTQRAA